MGRGGRPCPKPGPLSLERHSKRLTWQRAMDAVIADAKRRDGHRCRWPKCEYSAVDQPLDGAHVFQPKGMGGDKKLLRSERKHIMALCRLHHRAQEKHTLYVEEMTPDMADGPCMFWRESDDGSFGFYMVAQERAVGILERD